MLPVFLLLGIVGVAMLAYLWPQAVEHRAFKFTRLAFTAGIIAYAASHVATRIAMMEKDSDWLTATFVCEIIGWVGFFTGTKGVFMMLYARRSTEDE